ncbi:hypothetical protein [Nocardia sp. NPDC052316]|uniref:hypothetical protein n=1 Tax=Nocardia sp. NPDC052316 TaxID=3364329 RepID=UPI0037C89AA8
MSNQQIRAVPERQCRRLSIDAIEPNSIAPGSFPTTYIASKLQECSISRRASSMWTAGDHDSVRGADEKRESKRQGAATADEAYSTTRRFGQRTSTRGSSADRAVAGPAVELASHAKSATDIERQ